MNSDFVTWLTATIAQRGWTWSELARRATVSPAALSMIISAKNRPGNDLCLRVAKALDLPPEAVLRYAGLLPDLPAPVEELNLTELRDVMQYLQPRERRQVVEYALLLYRLRREDEQAEGAPGTG